MHHPAKMVEDKRHLQESLRECDSRSEELTVLVFQSVNASFPFMLFGFSVWDTVVEMDFIVQCSYECINSYHSLVTFPRQEEAGFRRIVPERSCQLLLWFSFSQIYCYNLVYFLHGYSLFYLDQIKCKLICANKLHLKRVLSIVLTQPYPFLTVYSV